MRPEEGKEQAKRATVQKEDDEDRYTAAEHGITLKLLRILPLNEK